MTIKNRRKCSRYPDDIQILYTGYQFCDYCEIRITDKFIHQTESGLLLCTDCCHHMESMPSVFEEALERFLLGNVL